MEKEVLFGTFDAFLISQMGFSLCGTLEQQEKIRKEAYHTFLNKIRGERPGIISDHTPVVWHPKHRCACT